MCLSAQHCQYSSETKCFLTEFDNLAREEYIDYGQTHLVLRSQAPGGNYKFVRQIDQVPSFPLYIETFIFIYLSEFYPMFLTKKPFS